MLPGGFCAAGTLAQHSSKACTEHGDWRHQSGSCSHLVHAMAIVSTNTMGTTSQCCLLGRQRRGTRQEGATMVDEFGSYNFNLLPAA